MVFFYSHAYLILPNHIKQSYLAQHFCYITCIDIEDVLKYVIYENGVDLMWVVDEKGGLASSHVDNNRLYNVFVSSV
jgi:hypothetical protein